MDKKVPDLDPAGPLNLDADFLYLAAQDGTDKKVPPRQLASYLQMDRVQRIQRLLKSLTLS